MREGEYKRHWQHPRASGSLRGVPMDVDPTVPVVKSLLLLDSEGKRIAVKYYAPEW